MEKMRALSVTSARARVTESSPGGKRHFQGKITQMCARLCPAGPVGATLPSAAFRRPAVTLSRRAPATHAKLKLMFALVAAGRQVFRCKRRQPLRCTPDLELPASTVCRLPALIVRHIPWSGVGGRNTQNAPCQSESRAHSRDMLLFFTWM